jgi:Ca2+-transporting ATPase
MAKRGLRCICLSYTDFPLEDPNRPEGFFDSAEQLDQNLTALAIVGIKDPVRKEVPEAVRICQKAGICVRMVTGGREGERAEQLATRTGRQAGKDSLLRWACGVLSAT